MSGSLQHPYYSALLKRNLLRKGRKAWEDKEQQWIQEDPQHSSVFPIMSVLWPGWGCGDIRLSAKHGAG